MDGYLQQVKEAIKFAQDKKTPFKPEQIDPTAYRTINKKGLYSLALKEWHKKAMANKMWASLKTIFAEGYHDLVEETKVTKWDAGFHSDNAMQEIGEGARTTSHDGRG